MNLIKQRLKMSKVPNVSDPSFSDQEVLDIIQNAGYTKYFTDKYKRSGAGTKINQGYYGFWTKQVAGVGVKNPIIFYNELYPFSQGGDVDSILVSWKYDTNNNITSDVCVTVLENMLPRQFVSKIESGMQLNNGYNVIGNFESLEEVKESINEDLKNINKNVEIN